MERRAHEGVRGALADVWQQTQEVAEGAFNSYRALPSFLYPAVHGTAAEHAIIMRQLDQLPLRDLSTISSIRVVNTISNTSDGIVMGVTRPVLGDMALARDGNSLRLVHGSWEVTGSLNQPVLEGTLVHEVGHGHDFQGGVLRQITHQQWSAKGPWGKGPFVSDYASTAAPEDFAESYANEHLTPQQLAEQPNQRPTGPLQDFSPAKHQALERSAQPSPLERLVDHKPFRDTGRLVGELTSQLPWLRAGLHVLGNLGTLTLVVGGVGDIAQGAIDHNKREVAHGVLGLAAGLSLGLSYASPVLGPAALALLGARSGIERADAQAAAAQDGSHQARKASTATEVAAAAGGALGGALGGVAGPLGGTWLGYTVAGPLGGVVGLVAGSLLGFKAGSTLGADAGIRLAGSHKPA